MKILLSLTLLLASGLAAATPDFRDARDFDLDAYRGDVVYLDFWASWCVPCRLSFPWLIDMQESHEKDGLRVIAVNVDSDRGDADSFLHGQATNFPIVLDPNGEIAQQYQIQGMPSSVLIGRDGKILQTHTGFRQQDKPHLEAALKAALHSGDPR